MADGSAPDGGAGSTAAAPVGREVELQVGAPASGGSCVARLDGQVVFVRHALPGERVLARITQDRGRFLLADAVQVRSASPDRVTAPCPYAGPGRCGGCDWQHADGDAQRRLKAAVVRELFARIAGVDVAVRVEPLDERLLGWRTRIAYAVGPDGRPGLHRHGSAHLEPVRRCLLGVPGVGDSTALARRWDGCTGVEAVAGDDGAPTLLVHRPGPGRQARGRRPPDRTEVIEGPARVRHEVSGRVFEVAAAGFWQVHPRAAAVLGAAVVAAGGIRPGERVLDLYAGAGMLTAALADAVGPTGSVLGIESSDAAVADAAANLAGLPWATVRQGRVDAELVASLGQRPDVVVADPPRAGVGTAALAASLALRPRAVVYLACDPATLARDVRRAADDGWSMTLLRAFD
ncbi:MAG: class I SAM-dependent RNA methyltransferase, partial [Jatrophihabitans sp.]